MAGSFGYDAETIDVSLAMGELSLLPAVRKADAGTLIVADGTSCRHQIHDGAGRDAHACRARAGDESPIAAALTRGKEGMEGAQYGRPCRSCRPRWSAPTPSRTG